MSPDADDERILSALERYYLAEDQGRTPDLDELAAGDPVLAERLASILRRAGVDILTLKGCLRTGPAAIAAPGPNAPPLPFERIGAFRILGRLGSGGMGQVFVARQEPLGRPVALKILDAAVSRDDVARRRFEREAKIAASLDHPGIVPIHAAGEDDGRFWIAMKWLTGPGLDELGLPLEAEEAARIGENVALALDEAHLAGVVHRDVKPSNVIFDGDRPVLVDFGLARGFDQTTLTRSGFLPGTLRYMAPELFSRRTAQADPRADIYALGATLYELLGGRPLFPEVEAEPLVRAILMRDPRPLALEGRERRLGAIVEKALDKDPDRRYASASDLAADLARWRRKEPVSAVSIGPTRRLLRRLARDRRLAAAAVVALVGLMIATTIVVWRLAGERATLERRLAAVNERMDEKRYDAALDLLQLLEADGISDSRISALDRLVHGRLALEDLLDEIIDRSNGTGMEQASRLVVDTGAIDIEPRTARALLTLNAIFRGDAARASAYLDAIEAMPGPHGGRDRDTICLRAAIGEGKVPDLTDSPATSSDRHLFAALGLRWIEAPFERQVEELDRALALAPDDFNTLLVLAVVRMRAGQTDLAKAMLVTLRSRRRRDATIVAQLIRLALLEGDLAEARRLFASSTLDPRRPTSLLLAADLAARSGDVEGAEAKLAEAREVTALGDGDVLLQSALFAQAAGRLDEAQSYLRALPTATLLIAQRQLATAIELSIELSQLHRRPAVDLASLRGDLRRRAREFGLTIDRGRARAWALQIAASCSERPEEAIDDLRLARAADPDVPGPRVAFLRIARAYVNAARTVPLNALLRELFEEALEDARHLIGGEGRGPLPPTRPEVESAVAMEVELLHALGRDEDCRAAARKALSRHADIDVELAERIRELDESSRRRLERPIDQK